MNNFLANITPFMLIIVRFMKLPTTKLCAICLGIIVVNLGNKCLFSKLCPLVAKFANVIKKILVSLKFNKYQVFTCHFIEKIGTLCINLHPFYWKSMHFVHKSSFSSPSAPSKAL
jgi:hypothetical protein